MQQLFCPPMLVVLLGLSVILLSAPGHTRHDIETIPVCVGPSLLARRRYGVSGDHSRSDLGWLSESYSCCRDGRRTSRRIRRITMTPFLFQFASAATFSTSYNVIPAAAMWSGGVDIFVDTQNGDCDVYSSRLRQAAIDGLQQCSGPVAAGGYQTFEAILLPNKPGVYQSTGGYSFRATFQPAPGFFLLNDITLCFVPRNAAGGGINENCTVGATAGVTVAKNVDGGVTSFQTSALNRYAVQSRTIVVKVGLLYSVFSDGNNKPVLTSPVASLNTGWSCGLDPDVSQNFSMICSHPPIPTFTLPSGSTATFSITVSPVGARTTVLPFAPVPNQMTFTIYPVDSPLAFCVLSRENITAGELRQGAQVILITLSPTQLDDFEVLNASAAASRWASAALNVPSGISVSFETSNAATVRWSLVAAASWFTDTPVQIVLNPNQNTLLSRTAGCGATSLTVLPSAARIVPDAPALNVTEIAMNTNVTILTFRSRLGLFAPSRQIVVNATVTRSANPNTSPRSFIKALQDVVQSTISGPKWVLLNATTNLDGLTATLTIPVLPTYNIELGEMECLRMSFGKASMESDITPATEPNDFCIIGSVAVAKVRWNSTGTSQTAATTLWDDGDVLNITLSGASWIPSAISLWNATVPFIRSPLSNGFENLPYAAINRSAVRFLSHNRTALIPFVRLSGLSVSADEVFSFLNTSRLVDTTEFINMTFQVRQPTAREVSFTCGGGCTMDSVSLLWNVSEATVRTGSWFTISSLYDSLVNETALRATKMDFITRNATSLVPYISQLQITRVNLTTVNCSFPALPDFDITATDVMVLRLNAWQVTNGLLDPAAQERGFVKIVRTEPQPLCFLFSTSTLLASSSTTIVPLFQTSEAEITKGDQLLTLGASQQYVASACQRIMNGLLTPGVFTASGTQLRMIQGTCPANPASKVVTVALSSTSSQQYTLYLLHLRLLRNQSYEISLDDQVSLTFNMDFFNIRQQCLPAPFAIKVTPAVATFRFFIGNASTTPVPVVNTSGTPTAELSEKSLRYSGVRIQILYTGERVSLCSFPLQYVVETADAVQSIGNFATLMRSKTITMVNTTRCLIGVTDAVNYSAFLDANAAYDIATSEVVVFSVGSGVGSSSQLPQSVNSRVLFQAQRETMDVLANTSTPLTSVSRIAEAAIAQNRSALAAVMAAPRCSLNSSIFNIGTEPSFNCIVSYLGEDLSYGTYLSMDLKLQGDNWAMDGGNFASAFVNALSISTSDGTSAYSLVTRQLLFSKVQRVDSKTMRFTAPLVPSFYATTDLFVNFSITSDMIVSGLLPIPSYFGFRVVSGPPILVPAGPALQGGTRQLLLGNLFVIVTLLNDVYKPLTLSSINVCPPPFDTCSLTVLPGGRQLNVSFPPLNLVLRRKAFYTLRLFNENIESGRTIANNVTYEIAVEAGIQTNVLLGGSTATDGRTETTETTWRQGGWSHVQFSLEGDTFVTTTSEILAGIVAGTTCDPPLLDSYSFCARLQYLLTGAVSILDEARQVLRIDFGPDALLDLYLSQRVTFGFSGIAVSSGLAPVRLKNMTFLVTKSAGELSITLSRSRPVILYSDELRYGSQVPIQISFALKGERWSAGVTTSHLVSSFNGTSTESTGFLATKASMFSSITVDPTSSGRRLFLYFVPSSTYSAPQGEVLTFAIPKRPSLFLSGLIPIVPVGESTIVATVPASSQGELQLTAPPAGAVAESVVRQTGVMASIRIVDTSNTLSWNQSQMLRWVATTGASATGAGRLLATDTMQLVEPRGLSRTLAAITTDNGLLRLPFNFETQLNSSTRTYTLQFAKMPTYELQSRTGVETWTVRPPTSWFYSSMYDAASWLAVTNTSFTPYVEPVSFQVQVTEETLWIVVWTDNLTTSSALAAQWSILLLEPVTLDIVSRAPLALSPVWFSNVSVRLTRPLGIAAAMSSSSPRWQARQLSDVTQTPLLRRCCGIRLVYLEEERPTDDVIRAAVDMPVSDGEGNGSDLTDDEQWIIVGVSLGVVALIVLGLFVYRKYISGRTFAGSNRDHYKEPPALNEMKLEVAVQHEVTAEELQLGALMKYQAEKQRVHSFEGQPVLSERTEGTSEAPLHDLLVAGQPRSALMMVPRREPRKLKPVEPIPEDPDENVAIRPSTLEGDAPPSLASLKERGSSVFSPGGSEGARTPGSMSPRAYAQRSAAFELI